MQNTSLIALLPPTESPNDYLTEELNENKAGSSDFQLNSLWRIAAAVYALLFRGHLHWCCSNEFGWQCFPGQPFRETGVDNFHKPLSFTINMKSITSLKFAELNRERTVRLKLFSSVLWHWLLETEVCLYQKYLSHKTRSSFFIN